MPIKWIEHKNKKILIADYSHLEKDGQLATISALADEIGKQDEKILLLSDFTNTFASKEFMSELQRVGTKTDKKIYKAAMIGIVGLKKLLLQAFNTFTKSQSIQKLFTDMEAAKDWLVED